jgi:probable DNA metabolism protein
MMTVFLYDKTFEGLLTCIFDAYRLKDFPEQLLLVDAPLPLFCDHHYTIVTDENKSARVWKHITAKLSAMGAKEVTNCWLSELPDIDLLLFRYLKKTIDSPRSIETNFADPDVLRLSQIYKKVSYEGHRLIQFARFQKTVDGTYFAPLEPQFNTLPLAIHHFCDRFSDEKFLIYDMKRHYGFYYDMQHVSEVTLTDEEERIKNGQLREEFADENESKYQQLWRSYYKTIAIKERLNPRKQRGRHASQILEIPH